MMLIVQGVIAAHGQPYIRRGTDDVTAEQLWNGVANRRLLMFSEKARCLFAEKIDLTLRVGAGLYDLRNKDGNTNVSVDGTAVLVAYPETLTAGGSLLTNNMGDTGPWSKTDFDSAYAGYQHSSTQGKVEAWMLIAPTKLRVYKLPDQAYSNTYLSGWLCHSAIDTSPAGDSTELSFPEEICECAALYVAVGLLKPNDASMDDFQRMRAINPDAAEQMRALFARSQHQQGGPSVRGTDRPVRMLG
jgi:hypothetical protein